MWARGLVVKDVFLKTVAFGLSLDSREECSEWKSVRGNSDGGNSLNQERHEERKEKCLKEHNTRETGVCGQVYLTTRPGSGTWTCSLGSGESRKICIGLSGV